MKRRFIYQVLAFNILFNFASAGRPELVSRSIQVRLSEMEMVRRAF